VHWPHGGGGSSSTSTSSTSSTEAMTVAHAGGQHQRLADRHHHRPGDHADVERRNAPSDGCTASGAWSGAVASQRHAAVTAGAAGTANYTPCGSVSNSAVVTISTPPPSPTVSLTLAPANITTAQSTVLSWSSANASSCSASGAWSGAKATSGSVTITPTAAGSFTYSLACTGDGGTATGSAALSVTAALSNSTAIIVDSGPSGVSGVINVPYVSVTVCRPGTTVCQTIDHVLLDTGSYGLRLLASQLNSTLALPAVTTASGDDAGECGKFISGYTWARCARPTSRSPTKWRPPSRSR
jgi:hypothetical protein